jgi:hypothetical protein
MDKRRPRGRGWLSVSTEMLEEESSSSTRPGAEKKSVEFRECSASFGPILVY